MLFFLLKMDKRLRLQLFILTLLVLGAGILPKTAEALKCYKCSSGCENQTIEEDCKTSYCVKETEVNGGSVIKKDCVYSDRQGICALREFSGDCFINTLENFGKFFKCNNEDDEDEGARAGGVERSSGFGTRKSCYCNTDLCNGEGDTGMKPNNTNTNSKSGAGSELSFGVSSGKTLVLFFIIVGGATTAAAGVLMKI